MSLTHFEVITLFVPDVTVARDFYRTVFEVDEVFGDDNSAVLAFSGTMVNLLADSQAPGLMAPVPVVASGARMLMTIRVGDVRAECERLASLGVQLLNGPIDRPWGRRTASFADPAGYVWELAQEI